MSRLYLVIPLLLLSLTASAQVWHPSLHLAQNGSIAVEGASGDSSARLSPTLDEAVEQVRRESGGRVLSATTTDSNGRPVHRIKLLTSQKQVQIREIEASYSH
ncbi:MAG: hypothetical protein OEZ16_06110 [Chromatiales bacterium]|nr:hypothetical protein [Chromatiales bacterium]